ncbi:hypothetical protein EDD18DRAFT_1397256 [Armillaria luteobubalina]|uniref:Uncharacterized protein n=1 Tax=Armillaria luteobubalina TaxID=153913 RepID=A0AA39QLH4_9AGAR|nr:hypothetical protein EDD18DRAFT_1397256 [Armillaria luteobubalina]
MTKAPSEVPTMRVLLKRPIKRLDRKRAYEAEKLEMHSAATFPAVHVDIEHVDMGGQRQWLGLGSDYGYGVRRERSDSLEVQIERELERRGYGSRKSFRALFQDIFLVEDTSNLFGRVFPPSTDHATSIRHALVTHETNVYDIRLADVGPQLAANATVGIPVEIVDPTFDDEMTGTQRLHERESAIHRPKLHVDTSVNETNNTEINYIIRRHLPEVFAAVLRKSIPVRDSCPTTAASRFCASPTTYIHTSRSHLIDRTPDYKLLECWPTSSMIPRWSIWAEIPLSPLIRRPWMLKNIRPEWGTLVYYSILIAANIRRAIPVPHKHTTLRLDDVL